MSRLPTITPSAACVRWSSCGRSCKALARTKAWRIIACCAVSSKPLAGKVRSLMNSFWCSSRRAQRGRRRPSIANGSGASRARRFVVEIQPQHGEAHEYKLNCYFFGALILSYVVYRHFYWEAFAAAGRHAKILHGTINTFLLLTSSLTMSLAIQAAQQGRNRPLLGFLLLTIFLGLCFLSVKGLEYKSDIDEHLVPGRHFTHELPVQGQIYWFLYWMLT